jgi:UDP-N-acetylglucosamine transferase subunit ALG13
MMAFDRLIRAMDKWAQDHAEHDVFAQIGGGSHQPRYMRWTSMMTPSKFRETVRDASIMVAHAGMGSFFTAMEMRKPIVMLPRRASDREHTTDHQLHTVRWLGEKPGVYVAMSDNELAVAIDKALMVENLAIGDFQSFAPEHFLTRIRQFLVN